jgi:hypothetical protein
MKMGQAIGSQLRCLNFCQPLPWFLYFHNGASMLRLEAGGLNGGINRKSPESNTLL